MSEMTIFGSHGIINSIGLENVVVISTSSPFSSRIENETDRERFVIDGIWNYDWMIMVRWLTMKIKAVSVIPTGL